MQISVKLVRRADGLCNLVVNDGVPFPCNIPFHEIDSARFKAIVDAALNAAAALMVEKMEQDVLGRLPDDL